MRQRHQRGNKGFMKTILCVSSLQNQVLLLKKYKYYITIVIILLTGIIIRGMINPVHFTHVDDVGFIASLASNNSGLLNKLKWWHTGWTYGPLQIILLSFLVNKKYGYYQNLIIGRLPSLVFSILNLFLALYLSRKVKGGRCGLTELSVVILLSFSWENIIYASQAEPYAIVVTSMFILLITFQDIVYCRKINVIKHSLIMALLCYTHS